jgi:hypothetical protein
MFHQILIKYNIISLEGNRRQKLSNTNALYLMVSIKKLRGFI